MDDLEKYRKRCHKNLSTTGIRLLEEMRANPNVNVRATEPAGVLACNFTRKAFYKGAWDKTTAKARGLFIHAETGKIVGRGYEKILQYG